MYGWIWRHLPGGTASRAVLAMLLLAAVSAVLLFVVFPWVDEVSPLSEVTVGD